MTKPDWLVDKLIALHAMHGAEHRRLLMALDAGDLLGVVEASRKQGQICSEQGAVLASYVASVVAEMPDVDVGYRNKVELLAQRLRAGQYG